MVVVDWDETETELDEVLVLDWPDWYWSLEVGDGDGDGSGVGVVCIVILKLCL